MKRLPLLSLLLATLLALTAPSCGGGSGDAPATSSPMPATRETAPDQVTLSTSGGTPAAEPLPTAPPQALRIYRATLRLQVDDPTEAAVRVRQIVQHQGGWLQVEREERESWEHRVYLELRVPPERFDTVVAQCVALARFVAQKDLNAEDVGQTYADLTARLEQKREVAAQYQQLLKRATSVQDILAVQEHLRRIQEEIESTEAQRLYLSRQAAHSTIMLTLYRPLEGAREPRASFWSRLGLAFVDGWIALQEFIIGVVSAWGVLVPMSLVVWGVLRWWRRRRKSSAESKSGEEVG